ncbi:MAG: 2-polyprenylphenol hydroxylase [Sulfolobaceae archaeon]
MLRGKLISIDKYNEIWKITIRIKFNPKPGQYISIVLPLEGEYPLSIGDYNNDILTLYVESRKIIEKISKLSNILIKGPLGIPIDLNGERILGISIGKYCYDLNYPLLYGIRQGKIARLYCIENCECEEIPRVKEMEHYDTILASLPLDLVKKIELPKNSYVYVRWVKMNCMLGVCGVCEFNGYLPCIQGPFMRLERIVDKR